MLFRTRSLPLVLIAAISASAGEPVPIRFEATQIPAPFLADGKLDGVIEASAVAPAGEGFWLVAHDKAPELILVEGATGRRVGPPLTSPGFPRADALGGPKWEGMARDGDGNYYVVGAHVGKTDAEREAKSVLLRFRLKADSSGPPTIEPGSVVRWNLGKSLEASLTALGLPKADVAKRKIEGLAVRVRGSRRELVFGLREPDDRVRAFAADVSNAADGAELKLEPLFSFDAGRNEGVKAQLTSLEHVPALGGFLLNTATEDDSNVYHGNTLWFVSDDPNAAPIRVATYEVAQKAEGLTVLDVVESTESITVSLLIVYDNDPQKTRIPSRHQVVKLTRSRR